MDGFWAKLAVLVIVIAGGIFAFNYFSGQSPPEPEPVERGFSDVIREDDARLRADPEEYVEVEQESDDQSEQDVQVVKREFNELSETDQIEAERLFEVAIKARSIGRLQTGFKLMVDTCRQIIEKFPDSVYAYKAKRMLADMPERYRKRYKITEDEINYDK